MKYLDSHFYVDFVYAAFKKLKKSTDIERPPKNKDN
jgi:hypothetical protein